MSEGRNKKKDVRNEGRTDYVLENTGSKDKLSYTKPVLFDEFALIMFTQ